jgi:hypothetical protein
MVHIAALPIDERVDQFVNVQHFVHVLLQWFVRRIAK